MSNTMSERFSLSRSAKNVFVLTKVLLVNAGAAFQIKFRKTESKKTTITFWVLIGLCLLPTVGMLYKGYDAMYVSFYDINQVDWLSAVVFNIIATVIFIFSLFSIPAIYYFSRDVENLLPLPLRDVEIIAAKFFVSVIFEYLLLALLLLPFYAVMIRHSNPLFFVPAGLVVYLLLPVFPLCYSSVVIMFLMSFSRFSKNKELFNIIAGILALVVGIGLSIGSQSLVKLDVEQITRALMNNESVLGYFAYFFPDNKFAAEAIVNGNFPSLLACIALPVAGFCVFLLIARLMYFKGVMGIDDARRSSRKLTAGNVAERSRSQSPLLAYMKKELKLIFRSPVTFMNCVTMDLLFPFMIIIPIYFSAADYMDELKAMDFSRGKPAVIMLAVLAAVGLFLGSMNLVSATAVSREGRGYFFMKYIPLHYRTQINAKIFVGVLLGEAGSILLMIALYVFMTPPVVICLGGFVLGLLGSVLINYLSFFVDLSYPKLNWDNEQQAVKQNLNTMIVMIISFVLIAAVTVPVCILFNEPLPAFAVLLVALALADVLVYRIVMRMSVRKLGAL